MVEATVKLDELVKKIGKAVEDSKPYWEARRVARQVCPEGQGSGLAFAELFYRCPAFPGFGGEDPLPL